MKIREYQEGGNMPSAPATGAPTGPEGGQDPIMQIADIFAQGLQSGDCNMLAQGAQMFIQLISQAMNQAGPQGPVDQNLYLKRVERLLSAKSVVSRSLKDKREV